MRSSSPPPIFPDDLWHGIRRGESWSRLVTAVRDGSVWYSNQRGEICKCRLWQFAKWVRAASTRLVARNPKSSGAES